MAENKYVDFVSDAHFEKCVKHVVDAYNKEFILEDKQLQKNGLPDFLIDEFMYECEGLIKH